MRPHGRTLLASTPTADQEIGRDLNFDWPSVSLFCMYGTACVET